MTTQLQPARPTATRHGGSSLGQAMAVVTVAISLLSVLVLSFVWPAARGEADGLSVAVTGDPARVEQFMEVAGAGLGEVLDLVVVADRDEAAAGIREREFIGGVVLADGAPEVLTASAAGQVPSAFMTAIAGELQTGLSAELYGAAAAGTPGLPTTLPLVQVTDVVPLAEEDPNGVGITAAGIPLTVGTLLCGIAISLSVTGGWRRLLAVIALAVGGGLVLALLLGPLLGVLPASFLVLWLALATSLGATAGLFVGLHGVLGPVGLGVAGGITLFAAMPWAAFAVPPAFLPAGLGHLGQYLIPGATATLARTISYFTEAPTAKLWAVLAAWASVGLALTLAWRAPRTGAVPSAPGSNGPQPAPSVT